MQAEQELGPEWTLMRSAQPGVPKLEDWLAGPNATVTEARLAEAQAELEVRVLTCFRVALLERMRLGAGRVRLGSFGVTFEAGDKKVMWVHGNGGEAWYMVS